MIKYQSDSQSSTAIQVATQCTEIQQGPTQAMYLRDSAITATLGELMAGLQSAKDGVRADIKAACQRYSEAQARVKLVMEALKAAMLPRAETEARTLAAKFKRCGLPCEAQVRSPFTLEAYTAPENDDDSAFLGVIHVSPNAAIRFQTKIVVFVTGTDKKYSRPELGFRVAVTDNRELRAAEAEVQKIADELQDLRVAEAEICKHMTQMPQTKMQIEAAVAKRDLLATDGGKALYADIQSEFGKLIPAELARFIKG